MNETQPTRQFGFLTVFPVAGVMCLLGAFVWAVLRTRFEPGSMGLAALGVLLFLTAFMKFDAASLRNYLNAGFYAGFVLGICVVGYLQLRPYNTKLDLTAQGLHSLSDATRKFLGLLKKDVEVVVFDIDYRKYKELLDQYRELSPHITWSLHDPRRDPAFTHKFDANVVDGMIYVVNGDKKKLLAETELDENTLTNAIVEVTRESRVHVYFLTGHGELEYESPPANAPPKARQRSLGAFRELLSKRAMEVAPLDLGVSGGIPDDATLLVIAGPWQDLFETEARQIERFIGRGGNLLVLFDIPPEKDKYDTKFTYLSEILRRRGIENKNEAILDLRGERLYDGPIQIPFVSYNERHPITAPLVRASVPLVLPLVRSLNALEKEFMELKIVPLVLSSPEAWAQPVSAWAGQVETRATPPGPDGLHARGIGWAVEDARAGHVRSRMVVFGTSNLVNNRVVEKNETAIELMLNSANWLTEQEDLIAIPKKIVSGTPLDLTNSEKQLILILLVMAFPSAILFGGLTYVRVIRR